MPQRTLITFKPIRVPLARTVNDQELYDALIAEVNSFAKDLKADFEETTSKWKKKPKFAVEPKTQGNKVTFKVYTNSLIYFMVSSGTKRHKIYARRAKALKLAGVKRSRSFSLETWTRVGLVNVPSVTTRHFTSQTFSKYVKHPGIKKRDYPAKIMRVRKPTFSPRMHKAITAAILRKKAGIRR